MGSTVPSENPGCWTHIDDYTTRDLLRFTGADLDYLAVGSPSRHRSLSPPSPKVYPARPRLRSDSPSSIDWFHEEFMTDSWQYACDATNILDALDLPAMIRLGGVDLDELCTDQRSTRSASVPFQRGNGLTTAPPRARSIPPSYTSWNPPSVPLKVLRSRKVFPSDTVNKPKKRKKTSAVPVDSSNNDESPPPIKKRARGPSNLNDHGKENVQVQKDEPMNDEIDLSKYFDISPPEEVYVRMFRTTALSHRVQFSPEVESFKRPFEELIDAMITTIFDRATVNNKPSDLCGIEFRWDGMAESRILPFRELTLFHPSAVRNEMFLQMQSGSNNINFSKEGYVKAVVVETIEGSGGAAHDGGPSENSNITLVKGPNLCLPKALVIAKAYVDAQCSNAPPSLGEHYRSVTRSAKILLRESAELMELAGVTKMRDYKAEDIRMFQDALPGYQIKVIANGSSLQPLWEGPFVAQNKVIALRYANRHFDVIKRLARFLDVKHVCAKCNVSFSNHEDHYNCPTRCRRCTHFDTTDCEGDGFIVCNDCLMPFQSNQCYARHKSPYGGQGVKSACLTNRICRQCKEPVFERTGQKKKHRCGQKYCLSCKEVRPISHQDCYLRPLKGPDPDFPAKSIFFDFECTIAKVDGRELHVPNLCIAFKTCRSCWKDMPSTLQDVPAPCTVFGPDRLKVWHSLDDRTAQPARLMLNWLNKNSQKGYRSIAHNLKGSWSRKSS